MKKTIYYILMVLVLFFLVSCHSSDTKIEAYAVVHYESDLMGGTAGKIIFGQQYNIKGKESTVYHINEEKKLMQIQPTRSGNYIFNKNAPWDDLGKFELIGTDTVYYFGDDFISGYQKISDDEINIYKITKIHDYGSVIMMDEMFLIKVSDITAFEFVYTIEDFE